ncbi:DNA-processing protein DprA [Candidatus Uabimicrobium sp. HlEnr_7]|uniref:DNA-processing protein DprA n=1 Tax=Candidatus Uabimicrobium helgolandensis TaxID=3095367 RepID=UPI003557C496
MNAIMIMGLSSIRGIGAKKIMRLQRLAKNIKQLTSLDNRILKTIVNDEQIAAIRQLNWGYFNEIYHNSSYRITTLNDKDYPQRLRKTFNPPLLLYTRGQINEKDSNAVAIVGTRKASRYGQKQARLLAEELAIRDITVVSGLAKGIDAAAHQGALTAGGRTIAVLGSGLDRIYPSCHQRLAELIGQNGACISEYAPQMPGLAHHFPQRNRIVAGLVAGIIVIEAPEKSGSLITAHIGLDNGRDIFVVPGNIDESNHLGGHKLIQNGAKLVTCINDVIEELPQLQINNKTKEVQLNKTQQQIWDVLTEIPQNIDKIVDKTELAIEVIMSELMEMRIENLVVCSHYNYYRCRGIVCRSDD